MKRTQDSCSCFLWLLSTLFSLLLVARVQPSTIYQRYDRRLPEVTDREGIDKDESPLLDPRNNFAPKWGGFRVSKDALVDVQRPYGFLNHRQEDTTFNPAAKMGEEMSDADEEINAQSEYVGRSPILQGEEKLKQDNEDNYRENIFNLIRQFPQGSGTEWESDFPTRDRTDMVLWSSGNLNRQIQEQPQAPMAKINRGESRTKRDTDLTICKLYFRICPRTDSTD